MEKEADACRWSRAVGQETIQYKEMTIGRRNNRRASTQRSKGLSKVCNNTSRTESHSRVGRQNEDGGRGKG